MRFKGLLQKDGWHENVEVTWDDKGLIISISETDKPCADYALPGFRNSHSHAFQYAMAGTAENHSNPNDDFWSWRNAMYELALSVDPDQLETIAAMLYSEMLRHGYTHVAEFHYLHHDKNGEHFDNIAEMGSRLIAAAERTGINITLVPVFYKLGGFGSPATEKQRRFVSADVDQYLRLIEATAQECKKYDHAHYGIGIHSLRAASAEDILAISEIGPQNVSFHIHIAEQLKEVKECEEFYGKRPVEWLLENIKVDQRFNLVHATYLSEPELIGIADSGASVVLCPTTEGNLGDGIFSLKHFKTHGGNWSLGTDSHVSLNPFEEIRLLDYGQRLTARTRNTFGARGSLYAIETVFDSGRAATGENAGRFFEIGKPFNACVISSDHQLLKNASRENRLNTIVYSSDTSMQRGAIANGRFFGADTDDLERIQQEFTQVIKELGNR
jgi:formimidoylglutamate deiminase